VNEHAVEPLGDPAIGRFFDAAREQ